MGRWRVYLNLIPRFLGTSRHGAPPQVYPWAAVINLGALFFACCRRLHYHHHQIRCLRRGWKRNISFSPWEYPCMQHSSTNHFFPPAGNRVHVLLETNRPNLPSLYILPSIDAEETVLQRVFYLSTCYLTTCLKKEAGTRKPQVFVSFLCYKVFVWLEDFNRGKSL